MTSRALHDSETEARGATVVRQSSGCQDAVSAGSQDSGLPGAPKSLCLTEHLPTKLRLTACRRGPRGPPTANATEPLGRQHAHVAGAA